MTLARNEIEEKYKWNLDSLYKNENEWEHDCQTVLELCKNLDNYKGKLNSNSDTLADCLELCEKIQIILENIFVYAKVKADEDNTNAYAISMEDKATSIYSQINSLMSFVEPEILEIDEKTLSSYIAESERLKPFKHYLENIIRHKEHILSKREEEILALVSEVTDAPSDIYTALYNADFKFEPVENSKGELLPLTNSLFHKYMLDRDRTLRKNAFKSLYKTFQEHINSLSKMYSYNIKKDIFYAKQRKFNSCLEASLFSDNVNLDVYENLIDTVKKHSDIYRRYLNVRKKILGLNELRIYDNTVPLTENYQANISYEQAKEMVLDGLSPLGTNYVNLLKKAFDERWIDVFENKGKSSGAYSWGSYTSNPIILMNYQNTLSDVYTLAHELGHSMHSYFSHNNQRYYNSKYSIFLAEIASTVNEAILTHYLLKHSTSKEMTISIINQYLDEIRGTIIRQTMFAEFEKLTHESFEKGQPLNSESFCEIYKNILDEYFGDAVVMDEEIKYEWARIPHFYKSFYVYKYATGCSAAAAITESIMNEGQSAVDRYIDFLKNGNSDYPLNVLDQTGVNLRTPEPIENALKVFSNFIDKLEELV